MTKQEFVEGRAKGSVTEVSCGRCRCTTQHTVVSSTERVWTEQHEEDIGRTGAFAQTWVHEHQVVRCLGCNTASFRELETLILADSREACAEGTRETLFPGAEARTRKHMALLPKNLSRLYEETITTFNKQCSTLCAGGLRALVEGICQDQGVTQGSVTVKLPSGGSRQEVRGNLEGKIAGLREKGVLTERSARILHEHRFMGNEALHELAAISWKELELAIDIIEHMLEHVYEIPEKAKQLSAERAARIAIP